MVLPYGGVWVGGWVVGRRGTQALKFGLGSRLGRPLHVEEDVGLGLHHSVFVRGRHRAVVEVEPAPLVRGVGSVVSRPDAKNKQETPQPV